MKEKEKTEQGSVYSIYLYIYIFRWITWLFENKLPRAIYKENYKTKYLRLFTPFPNLITKESYNWWVTRRKWKFIQIYLKKKSKRVGAQISGSTKDYFAGENEVCEISQMHKKSYEITSQQTVDFAPLRSDLSACSIRLPTCRETSGGIPQHCAKRLRNHFATKGWFRSRAKFFLQLGVIVLQ